MSDYTANSYRSDIHYAAFFSLSLYDLLTPCVPSQFEAAYHKRLLFLNLSNPGKVDEICFNISSLTDTLYGGRQVQNAPQRHNTFPLGENTQQYNITSLPCVAILTSLHKRNAA